MKRSLLFVLAALAATAGGGDWRLNESKAAEGPVARVSPLQTAEFGGPFALTDQYGKRRTDADFRGKYMLIFFGYTNCPDVCPTALAVAAQALDELGPQANQIAPIFITVDPKRDTSDTLKAYLSAFDAKPPSTRPGFVGLTGSDADIAKAADAYAVFYQAHLDGRFGGSAGYSVDHSSHTYLMSPEGKFVAYYTLGILPDELAADLKKKITPPR